MQTHTVHNNDIIQTSVYPKLADYMDGKEYIQKHLAAQCAIWNASMLLFKKDCYYKASERFTKFKMCGDWQFYIELAAQGQVFISGKVLNYFRNHDKDVSGKMYRTGANYIEEIDILTGLINASLITIEEFKKHILTKYLFFLAARNGFTSEMNNVIEREFFNANGLNLKGFLVNNSRRVLIKARIKRRLNILLDNY